MWNRATCSNRTSITASHSRYTPNTSGPRCACDSPTTSPHPTVTPITNLEWCSEMSGVKRDKRLALIFSIIALKAGPSECQRSDNDIFTTMGTRHNKTQLTLWRLSLVPSKMAEMKTKLNANVTQISSEHPDFLETCGTPTRVTQMLWEPWCEARTSSQWLRVFIWNYDDGKIVASYNLWLPASGVFEGGICRLTGVPEDWMDKSVYINHIWGYICLNVLSQGALE